MMKPTADWIAIDWGTTHLRAYAVRGREVVAEATSSRGMSSLERADFEPALLELVSGWLVPDRAMDIICCGMVGSRQGWVEAPYNRVPCQAGAGAMVQAPTQDTRIRVHVLPGISQATPPDVMRGEETQIAGFLSLNPNWDGVICLPGTHSKWVHISANEIISFQTFLTGEMFALLAGHSVLRHSIAQTGWDDVTFREALNDTLSKPETMAARLFRLRASDLLSGTTPVKARAELSGLLIGSELAATRAYWLGQQVAVIGADEIARGYVTALEHQGVAATLARVDKMTLAGLTAAHRTLEPAA